MSSEPSKPTRTWRKLLGWLGEHVVGALIAALVALGVTGAIAILKGGDTPIREQLADLRKEFDSQGWRITRYARLSLREGVTTHLFALSRQDPSSRRSDEFALYESTGGKLQRALRFSPVIDAPGGWDATGDRFFDGRFSFVAAPDIGGDGRRELVGSYDDLYPGTLRVPIAAAWDESRERYVVSPVIVEATKLRAGPGLDRYLVGFRFRDRGSGRAFTAYGTGDLAVVAGTGGSLPSDRAAVIGGLRSFDAQASRTALLVTAWGLTFKGARPQTYAFCRSTPSGGSDAVLRVLTPSDPRSQLPQTWAQVQRDDQRARQGDPTASGKTMGVIIPGQGCLFGE